MSSGSNFLIYHHLGLGDHFICEGLVRWILSRYPNQMTLACKRINAPTVMSIFRNTNLNFLAVNKDDDISWSPSRTIKIGFNNINPENFERSFYDQVGLSYKFRFLLSNIQRDYARESHLIKMIQPPKNFALACNATSQCTYNISFKTNLPIIRVSKLTDNIIDWVGLIQAATEIHTVDTSFFHLVKNLCITNKRKVFYNNRITDGHTNTSVKFDGQTWEVSPL